MQTNRQPYEFLVRWSADGELSGAHVQWRFITSDADGKVVGEFLSDPEPVAMADQNGFPLSQVLDAIQIAALRGREAALSMLAMGS